MTEQKKTPNLIPPHGGYRDLQSYQMAEIAYDGAVVFCDRFISRKDSTGPERKPGVKEGKDDLQSRRPPALIGPATSALL